MNDAQLCYLGGFPGDGLWELFGVISEEIDALYPSDRNGILLEDGSRWEVMDCAEILRVQDAKVLGTYTDDFYQGSAALTCKNHGKGNAYYVAARTEASQMSALFEKMLADAGIPVKKLPEGVEYHVRSGEEGNYEFYLNCTTEPVELSGVNGYDMVTDAPVSEKLTLPEYGAAVIRL